MKSKRIRYGVVGAGNIAQPDQEMNKPRVKEQETVNAPSPSRN